MTSNYPDVKCNFKGSHRGHCFICWITHAECYPFDLLKYLGIREKNDESATRIPPFFEEFVMILMWIAGLLRFHHGFQIRNITSNVFICNKPVL